MSGYIRDLMKLYPSLDIPKDIIKVIVIFYPCFIKFNGNRVDLTDKEKEIITSWFIDLFNLQNESCILSSKLLYDHDKDGVTSSYSNSFYNNCLNAKNTFSIVQTHFNDHVFGCFLSKPLQKWPSNQSGFGPIKIEDDKAFLCLIRSGFKKEQLEPQIFKIKADCAADAYSEYNNDLPCFGTSFDLQLSSPLSNYCDHRYTKFDGIAGNILCGGKEYDKSKRQNFKIKHLTTFEISIV